MLILFYNISKLDYFNCFEQCYSNLSKAASGLLVLSGLLIYSFYGNNYFSFNIKFFSWDNFVTLRFFLFKTYFLIFDAYIYDFLLILVIWSIYSFSILFSFSSVIFKRLVSSKRSYSLFDYYSIIFMF